MNDSNVSKLSKWFHGASKNFYSPLSVSSDPLHWPKEWKTTYYKKYERFEVYPLLQSEEFLNADLKDVLSTRESQRNFTGAALTFRELSSWFKLVCGEISRIDNSNTKRTYPSGGARYSIEHYILLFRPVEMLPAGVYHYRVDTHALELLEKKEWSAEDFSRIASVEWLEKTSCLHVMSSVFWRSQNKYKERGYRLALLEAGHVGQNAYLVSEALNMKCCALSGIYDDTLETLLDIDGYSESLVHAVAVGR